MLKKTIKYEDYDGNQREEDYYFFISKTELSQLELSTDGGFSKKIERIAKAQSAPELMEVFTKVIGIAYGIKSDDGKRFKKSPEILDDFKSTPAYDALYMELITDTKAAVNFITGILPADIASKVQEQQSTADVNN